MTCSNMVDIFEIAPQGGVARITPAAYAPSGQDARLARYQTLLSKLSVDDLAADARIDWTLQEEDTVEMQRSVPPVKAEVGEPLVGNFADAAAAVA